MAEEQKDTLAPGEREIHALAEVGLFAFLKATEKQLEMAIRHASDIIDTLPFTGWKLSNEQTRAWPRCGVYLTDGAPVTETPVEIEEVCYLLAGFFLAEVPLKEPLDRLIMPRIDHLLRHENGDGRMLLMWH